MTKRLKPLERYAGSPEEFKDLCFLLTCKNIQDAPSFKNWDGAKGNSRCAAHSPPPSPVQAAAGHSSLFFALRSSFFFALLHVQARLTLGLLVHREHVVEQFEAMFHLEIRRLGQVRDSPAHSAQHETHTPLCHTIIGEASYSQRRRRQLLGRSHRGFATQPHAALAPPGRGLSDGVYALPPQGRAQDQHVRATPPFLHRTTRAPPHTDAHHRTRRLP